MDPETSLHDLPVEPAILANKSIELVDRSLVQVSETAPTLWNDPGEPGNKSGKVACNAPGRRVRDQRSDARLARGCAGGEVPAQAPAAQGNTCWVDIRLCDREIDNGGNHLLPIRTKVNAMLIQHLALSWTVKEKAVIPSPGCCHRGGEIDVGDGFA